MFHIIDIKSKTVVQSPSKLTKIFTSNNEFLKHFLICIDHRNSSVSSAATKPSSNKITELKYECEQLK